MDKDSQANVATDLENLQTALQDIIDKLRQGQPDPIAHALVYEFRKRVSYALRGFKQVGVPTRGNAEKAEKLIDAHIWAATKARLKVQQK